MENLYFTKYFVKSLSIKLIPNKMKTLKQLFFLPLIVLTINACSKKDSTSSTSNNSTTTTTGTLQVIVNYCTHGCATDLKNCLDACNYVIQVTGVSGTTPGTG